VLVDRAGGSYYFADDDGAIRRAPIAGGAPQVVIGGLATPTGMALLPAAAAPAPALGGKVYVLFAGLLVAAMAALGRVRRRLPASVLRGNYG
jgi:MYXO-CTERM domain-containing protein